MTRDSQSPQAHGSAPASPEAVSLDDAPKGQHATAPPHYRSLDAERVLATLVRLRKRIGERFPDSGLERICAELVLHGEQARERAAAIGRPLIWQKIMIVQTLSSSKRNTAT